ncbi:hypothetical protein EJ04DRAFT_567432 [Polyplosphaeria fusca]|uniref:Uncharacterized protein n=1 Tax=Polyplosphaeria fusca TaxID=682080 RepID=A0A9P4QSB7_9PLEO|nr:hypothetical protein EJ04DRAFT_567432 [Polyplosphaeria fusca]
MSANLPTHKASQGTRQTGMFSNSRNTDSRDTPSDDEAQEAPSRSRSLNWYRSRLQDRDVYLICATGARALEQLQGFTVPNLLQKAFRVPSLVSSASSSRFQLRAYAERMLGLEEVGPYIPMTNALNLLLFYIVSSDNESDWIRSFYRRVNMLKLCRLGTSEKASLHEFWKDFRPKGISEEDFMNRFQEWRKHGAFYALMARELGLGSLIYLLHIFPPDRLGGCSLGNDLSGGTEKTITMLKDKIGLHHAVDTGANAFMHDLVWGLMKTFPGTQQRPTPKTPFPGLEGPLHQGEYDWETLFPEPGGNGSGGQLSSRRRSKTGGGRAY